MTEKHYLPWVKARQRQLTANVRRAWFSEVKRPAVQLRQRDFHVTVANCHSLKLHHWVARAYYASAVVSMRRPLAFAYSRSDCGASNAVSSCLGTLRHLFKNFAKITKPEGMPEEWWSRYGSADDLPPPDRNAVSAPVIHPRLHHRFSQVRPQSISQLEDLDLASS